MKREIVTRTLLLVMLITSPALAQDPEVAPVTATAAADTNAATEHLPQDMNQWATEILKKYLSGSVARNADRQSSFRQTENPSAASNSTSLVDTSSATDLLSIALDIGSLALGSKGSDADSISATASGYAFYSALTGADPLLPTTYCRNSSKFARMVSFTLGMDSEKGESGGSGDGGSGGAEGDDGSMSSADRSLVTYGVKVRFSPGESDFAPMGDACVALAKNKTRVNGAFAAFATAANPVLNKLDDNLAAKLYERYHADKSMLEAVGVPNFTGEPNEFRNMIAEDPKKFALMIAEVKKRNDLEAIEEEVSSDNQAQIAEVKGPYGAYHDTVQSMLDEISENEWAVTATGKSGSARDEKYTVGLIFNHKMAGARATFAGNLGAELTPNPASEAGEDEGVETKADLGVALEFVLWKPDSVEAGKPMTLTLAVDGKWGNGKPELKAQAKTTLTSAIGGLEPLKIIDLAGVEIPISITIANRTDLVEETEVRGQVGFSIDTSSLVALLKK